MSTKPYRFSICTSKGDQFSARLSDHTLLQAKSLSQTLHCRLSFNVLQLLRRFLRFQSNFCSVQYSKLIFMLAFYTLSHTITGFSTLYKTYIRHPQFLNPFERGEIQQKRQRISWILCLDYQFAWSSGYASVLLCFTKCLLEMLSILSFDKSFILPICHIFNSFYTN